MKCKKCDNDLLEPLNVGEDVRGNEILVNRHCPSGVCFDCHDCDLEST